MRTTALLTCERGLCCCRLIAAAHTLRLLSLLCREQSTFNMKVNIKIKFNIQHSTFNIQKVPSIETGSIVCSLVHWLSRSHPTCEEQCIFFIFQKFKRAPMFVLEFEKPLFEFEYATPHWDLLSALPPTFSSSTICCLFTALKPDTYRKKVSPARLYVFVLSLKSWICDEAKARRLNLWSLI